MHENEKYFTREFVKLCEIKRRYKGPYFTLEMNGTDKIEEALIPL